MSDFIKSIEVSLEQLDYTKTQGLEKGISNVIMENTVMNNNLWRGGVRPMVASYGKLMMWFFFND